ncbi:hypothetical protein C461_09457 [Halorubrum aidingense JCM 13560]|uniref:Uncharacterized protein n=1 Tax=Halorubrum aidingense JCM 13560 TaxID=1230454 RepID=M0PBS2_9EURY|nr:hypothetical protein [Halorubrum aidingense]EMA66974.1 hypothetical protein C461_09457 [Halorubrum aidingense JCM 13560]
MSDTSFTLLEITLGDGDIDIGPLGLVVEPGETAAAARPADGVTGDSVADDGSNGDGSNVDDGGCGCSVATVGLALLVAGLVTALGFAAAKFLGRDEDVPSGIAGDE